MWTIERVQRLTSLWAAGSSAAEIACDLGGVTRNAVIGKLDRLGLLGRGKVLRPRRIRPARIATPRERHTVKPSRFQPSQYFRRSPVAVQTKSQIAAEFAQIWANTVAIQNAGRSA